ncbi:MAG: DUF4845 domain-containing protein [Gammaproteobacteria bacterium]
MVDIMGKSFKGPGYQRGVSKFGLLIMGLFVALFLTVGLKVGPLYMDNSVVNSLADELVADGTADRLRVDEIKQRFADALRLNSIYDFQLSDIEVARAGGRTAIRIAYERRIPLLANLDIVAVFDHTAQ